MLKVGRFSNNVVTSRALVHFCQLASCHENKVSDHKNAEHDKGKSVNCL